MGLQSPGPTTATVEAIRRWSPATLAERPPVTVEGIVTGAVPGGGVFLQQGKAGIEVSAHASLGPASRGQRIRVHGVVRETRDGTMLVPTRVEPLDAPGVPAPVPTTGKALKDARLHGTRLSVEGVVMATTPVAGEATEGMPESLVLIEAGGEWVTVAVQRRWPPLDLGPLQGLRIRAEGVARPVRNPAGQVIDTDLLATPGDRMESLAPGPAPSMPATPIGDLRRRTDQADASTPACIGGVVTAALSGTSGLLQDESGGILFRTVHPNECKPGDIVELMGVPRVEQTRGKSPGMEHVVVVFEASEVRRKGRRALPPAEPATHGQLESKRLQFRRVAIEGRVLSASRLGESSLFRVSMKCGPHLVDATGNGGRIPSGLPPSGSMVRVRGCLDRRAQEDTDFQPFRLHLAGLGDVELLRGPPRDLTRALSWMLGGTLALGLATTAWALALRRGVRLRTADLASANKALAVASRARGDFLAHMSHEVRTPVHAMLGLLQLLARQPLAPEPMAMVRRLTTAGRSLVSIVNDALDLSKIDAGQLALDSHPFRPSSLLVHIDELFAARAAEKGLAWRVERLPPDMDRPLVGDRFRLQQVLGNLASNAIKFTRAGHVRITAEAGPSPCGGRMTLRVRVEDSGPGIDSDALAMLFQPFVQARPLADARQGGAGLGLAISRRLMERMGGHLNAASAPGVGSTFTMELDLPCASAAGPTPENHGPPAGEARPPGRRLEGCRVLVADDHPLNLGIIEAAIGMEGGCTLLVADGMQAVDAMAREPHGFDAIVMDVQMPVMDGLEATRRIRGMVGGKVLPLILCTAGIRAAQVEAALVAGASALLPKPFNLDELVSALAHDIQPRAPGPESTEGSEPTTDPTGHGTLAAPHDAKPFPAVHGIDRAEAVRRFGGNLPLFLRSLGRFHAEFAPMATALGAGDIPRGPGLGRWLHGLRGAALMVGATALASGVGELESWLAGNPGGAAPRQSVERVATELAAVMAAIRALDPESG